MSLTNCLQAPVTRHARGAQRGPRQPRPRVLGRTKMRRRPASFSYEHLDVISGGGARRALVLQSVPAFPLSLCVRIRRLVACTVRDLGQEEEGS